MAKKNTPSEGGQTKGRLQSLDALRGFDMLFIMGGAGLVTGLATLIPCPFTEALAGQMTFCVSPAHQWFSMITSLQVSSSQKYNVIPR